MNLASIKADINRITGASILSLDMVRQYSERTNPTTNVVERIKEPWLSHWDNVNRVRVTMPEEIFSMLKQNAAIEGLAYKYEQIASKPATATTAATAAYHRFVIITPKDIEGTF